MKPKKIIKKVKVKESLEMIQTILILKQIVDGAKLDKDNLEINIAEIVEDSRVILGTMGDDKLMSKIINGMQSEEGEIKL